MERSHSKFTLLLVDDEPMVLSSLKRTFFEHDYQIYTSENGHEALDLIRSVPVHAALIDLKMRQMDGLALLKEIRKRSPMIMCMMLTGHGGIREAVESIKLGAVDFLQKPYVPEELCSRIEELHCIWRWKEGRDGLEEKKEEFHYDSLVGKSPAMLELKETIVRAAPSDATILIVGETGTGKELIAHAVHLHSSRRENAFVPVDCATLNEMVIESELFGHLKGAFTGAQLSNAGLIASADGGTLFLDEIGEFPLTLQPKLLRVLQQREVRPVGSAKSRSVDVRVVAATNRDLEAEAAAGSFRRDLLYRLNVITIHAPPLRDRREDIPLLAEHFKERYKSKLSPVRSISPAALRCMTQHDWPGNVRELENVIQRAVALAREETISPQDLPARFSAAASKKAEPPLLPTLTNMGEFERTAIENALRLSGGNRKKAAELLGIGEATLYRKLKKYPKA